MAGWPYNTRRWRRLRADKLATDPWCEYCQRGHRRPATQVDHRQAITDGGDPWQWMNLVSACSTCHARKTAYADGGFGRRRGKVPVVGCDADGRPLDPKHWWNDDRKISQG